MKSGLTNFFNTCFSRVRCLLILMVLSLLMAGCGGALERSSAPAARGVAEPIPANSPGQAEGSAESGLSNASGNIAPIDDILAGATAQAQGPRVIIYTGAMSLVVKDTQAAVKAITALANEQGGYVASSNIYQSGQVPRGSITIRIPAENYQMTVARLAELAVRVESETTNTQDVTEEFTDLGARKTNLEFTEAALQKLLDERERTGSTSDILEVYRELTDIRGQIEQIEGRLRYLANQSALSTITVELIPDVLSQPVSIAGWQPQGVAKEALQALVVALQGLGNVLIWLLIFLLPLLIVILSPVVLVIWLIRRWWKRSKARRGSSGQVEKVAKESAQQT